MGDYRALNDDFDDPPKRSCWKRKVCCKKVTVWQLLLTILFVVVSMVLVAYFVLVPHYIQKIVNRTDLSFVSVMMRNITNSTVTISAQGIISASPFTASIFPAKNFSISYQNIHMGYMDLPQISSKGGQPTDLYINDTIITISNSSHFIQYASDLLNSAQANWNIDGHVDVTVWKFTYRKFKFSKSVSITGMNGLAGTTVDSFSLPGDGPGHLKVEISSSIFNPSFVCMQIGDMSFDVIFENNTIGSVTAPNVTLLNGTNYYTMTGVIQPTDAAGLQAVNNFVNQYVSGAPSSVSVRGAGGSASAPPWLNTVLQSLQMTTQIAGIQNLTLISDLSLNEISMSLPGEAGDTTDSGLVGMSSFVISQYQSPFPALTVTFNSITIQSNMTDETDSVYGTFPSNTYAVFNQSKTHLGFQMDNAELYITDRPLFMGLVEQLLLTPSATFTLTGIASANITTRIGILVLENVNLTQTITLNGVNGFADYAIKILTPNNHIVAGYDWGFELFLDTSILNPSSAAMQFSRLSFDIFYLGTYIGNGTSGNVSMIKGENYVTVQGKYIQPDNLDLQREFMSKYLQGNDSEVQLVGNSYNIPLVIPAMSKLNVTVVFPGNEQSLLAWAKLHIPPAGELALYNPIDCVVSISSLTNFQIYKTDWHYFTTAYDTTFDPPFEILPEQINITEPMKMKLTIQEFFSVFEGYLFGNHTLLATGVVGVSIENFGPLVIDAQQNFTMVGL